MLVLTRKLGESVYINHNIKITIVDIGTSQVKIAFDCPKNIPILREELRTTVEKQNKLAQNMNMIDCTKLKSLWRTSYDRSKEPLWQFQSKQK